MNTLRPILLVLFAIPLLGCPPHPSSSVARSCTMTARAELRAP